MRKWLWLGAMSVALVGGGVWYLHRWERPEREFFQNSWVSDQIESGPRNHHRVARNDGDAEVSETIEPLRVEGSVQAPTLPTLPVLEAPPVVLTPDLTQQPRPDAGSSIVPRMPYADEDLYILWPLDPLLRIWETTPLSKLKLFEKVKDADPAEEAEPKQPKPTTEPPLPLQTPDYHHQHGHCPYPGSHCPAPYPYYPRR